LTSVCEFPGRRLFEWALLLPMAIPAYIIAYTYTGLLDFAGPVQTALRETFGWTRQDYWFPEVRSLPGAVAMLALVLYPYVYLLARAAFLEQSAAVLEVSRSLGAGPWRRFLDVALPLARPALIAGVSLVQMEALADYGTVQYFGVSTFTTGIFRVWFGMNDATAAAQLATLLLLFVFALLVMERLSRRQARFIIPVAASQRPPRVPLPVKRGGLAVLACLIPLLMRFPDSQRGLGGLGDTNRAARMVDERFLHLAANSLLLAAGAAGLISAAGLAVGLWATPATATAGAVGGARRRTGLRGARHGDRHRGDVAIRRYRSERGWLGARWFGVSTGLLLSGTLIALLFAYCARFLPVALHSVEAGLTRIRPSMDDAARALGATPRAVLWRVHAPMLRGSLLTALLLVFVDVLKELPATLILRPFNFNTLAVRTYELASDERLADSASFALAIVLAGIGPVILLSRAIGRARTWTVTPFLELIDLDVAYPPRKVIRDLTLRMSHARHRLPAGTQRLRQDHFATGHRRFRAVAAWLHPVGGDRTQSARLDLTAGAAADRADVSGSGAVSPSACR
jgi:iron(III) transport system permease protein